MARFDELRVWSDPPIADALGWYRAVAGDRRPAKFRIAATIPLDLPLAAAEDDLWAEHDRLAPIFEARWRAIRDEGAALGPAAAGGSLLDLCRELTDRMLAHCNFCQWHCRVDRRTGAKPGACKLASETRVSSYFHHPGEEAFYRGDQGSGTIFFSSCNMRCAFCQNGDISTDKDSGRVTDARTLAAMVWLLRMEGCHNINWVGGEVAIHLHTVVAAIAILGGLDAAPDRDAVRRARAVKADRAQVRAAGELGGLYNGAFNAPMLWNSNFFMSEEAMKILRPLVDVWLPDFKFGPGRCAISLARTPRYWETVTRNLGLVECWGEDLTIRHLVMPGHVDCCTRPVLDWVAEHMPRAPVNIMDQYRPDNFCDPRNPGFDFRHRDMSRRPTRAELREAYRHAESVGVHFESATHERRQALLKAR